MRGVLVYHIRFMGLGKRHRHPFPLSSSPPDPANPAAPTDLDLDSSAAAAVALENGQNDAHLLPPFGRGGAPPPWKPTDLDRRKAGSLSINRDTTPSAPIPPLPPTDPDREEDGVDEEDEEGRKQPQGQAEEAIAKAAGTNAVTGLGGPSPQPSISGRLPFPSSLLLPFSSLWGFFDGDSDEEAVTCGVTADGLLVDLILGGCKEQTAGMHREHHDLLEEHAIMMMDGVEKEKRASMEHETAIIAMWADDSTVVNKTRIVDMRLKEF
ncbi:hypothetical protein MUK42_03041 [Musa troglodytarum]|uniref:Uncharacterized protein n=1 Tax=Musa troglodytarum TaxID=320322 RepID=A0A9E7K216_9LILI|nr:hypothetical protein MUK42_03041 [Musa troglodytarum]